MLLERFQRSDKVKTPERLSINPNHDALQARLLMGGDSINPDKKDLPQTRLDLLGNFQTRDYGVFNSASTGERKHFWQDKEGNDFDRQKTKWTADTVTCLKNAQDFFAKNEQGKRWSRTYLKIGIDTQNVTSSTVESLYDKYFTDPGKNSDIKKFVTDIVSSYKNNGVIDHIELRKDLAGIEWMANIFGETSAEIVAQLIDAEVKLQTQPNVLIDKANETQTINGNPTLRLNNLNPDEDRLLRFLWKSPVKIQQPIPPEKPIKPQDESLEKSEQYDPLRPERPTPTTEDISRYKTRLKRIDKQDSIEGTIREFPNSDTTHLLVNPQIVADGLKRKYPAIYTQDRNILAQEIKQERENFASWLNKINLPPEYYTQMVEKNLGEYAEFLHKKFGLNLPTVKHLTIVPIYGKTSELWNPGSRALAFVNPRYPVIFLDFSVIAEHAKRIGKASMQELNSKELGVILERLLNEIQPHEYTHILADIANWHLIKDEDTADEKTTDIGPAKLGLFLVKPTPPKVSAEDKLILKERGRWLMEAVTVELTDQWLREVKDRPLKLPVYAAEREVLNTLITQIAKERHTSKEDVFKKFVDGYFKPKGLRELIHYLSGKKITREGSKMKINYDENRKHFMQVIYALMEFEASEGSKHNYPVDYDLTKNYITGQLLPQQKKQIETFLQDYSRQTSSIQLTPDAIDEMRNEMQNVRPQLLTA